MGVECPILRLNLKAEAQTLIDALALDVLDEWAAIVVAIPAAEPLAWLAAIGKAYLELALQGPRRYEAAFLLHFEKSRRYPDDFVERRGPAGRSSS